MAAGHGGTDRSRARRAAIALGLVLSIALAACGSSGSDDASPPRSSTTSTASPTSTSTTLAPASTTTTVQNLSARERLAVLAIDDRPSPQGDYRRDAWSHWDDIDGNGCDARQDALVAWSVEPTTIDRSRGCRVVAGNWVSPYDLVQSNNPSDFDVDHLVPLEDAFDSGGWNWTAERRRAFANDQAELVVASAHSNRSKGSKSPDEWRPDNRDSWCAYADGWIEVKSSWGLTATTSERDALGQMLDTCGLGGPVWPRGGGAALTSPPPQVSGGASGGANGGGGSGGDVYYANCSAVRAAGAAPLYRDQPGYRSALDRDDDGVACE